MESFVRDAVHEITSLRVWIQRFGSSTIDNAQDATGSGGNYTLILKLGTGALRSRVVLKLSYSKPWPWSLSLEAETKLADHLRQNGVRCPEVLLQGSGSNFDFAVFEYIDNENNFVAAIKGNKHFLSSVIDQVRLLHSAPQEPKDMPLGLEDQIDNLSDDTIDWFEKFFDSTPIIPDAFYDGIKFLRAKKGLSKNICLLHGDFRPQNVLFAEGQPPALIDFEFSCLGQRERDLAWFCLPMWHNQNSMQALGFTLREIADLYNSREGNKSVDFFDLRYWFVFSCVNYSKISVHMFNAAQESPPTRDDWAQSARTNVELATAVMSEALELT